MDENTYWLSFWAIIAAMVVGTTWTVMHHLNEKTKLMIQAGYVEEQVPTAYTSEWVKK